MEIEKKQHDMIEKKSWKDFRSTGLLWWINTLLHTFGWAIVVSMDSETKEIIEVYPARVKFRGFSQSSIEEGYRNVSKYMKENSDQLLKEAEE